MAEPRASEFKWPCSYLRKVTAPKDADDFRREANPFRQVARGRLKLTPKAGTDIEIADGLENIVTYDAWDRWHSGILITDLVQIEDPEVLALPQGTAAEFLRLNIRRIVNDNNRWLVMTLVHRVPAIEGVLDG